MEKNKNDFLKKLKDSVDSGEFNSEAAQKINEISELAEKKMSDPSIVGESDVDKLNSFNETLNNRVKDGGIKKVDEKDVDKLNTEYEKKMDEFKKLDEVNRNVAILIEHDDTIDLTITSLLERINEMEKKYKKELKKPKNDTYGQLLKKINELKTKYK